jgi:hypothetical protein
VNELQLQTLPILHGATVYATVLNGSSQFWNSNSSAFENFNPADQGYYAIGCAEQSTQGLYFGDMPTAVPGGFYFVTFWRQIGGSPSQYDEQIGFQQSLQWPGTPSSTPLGPLAIAVSAVASLLPNVPYFQTWTGTANPTAAAGQVFTGEVGYPIASLSVAGGVLTVQTRETNTLAAAQTVTLDGASIGVESSANLAGAYTIISATGNSFTAAAPANFPDTESFCPDGAWVTPSLRPFALVSSAARALSAIVNTTGGAAIWNGDVEVLFENNVPTQYQNDPVNAINQAQSEFGQLFMGICQTAGTQNFIVLGEAPETVYEPAMISGAEVGDNTIRFARWRALIRIPWGLKS